MRIPTLPLQFGLFYLAVTIPLAALLVYQNANAIAVVHHQVAQSETRVLAALKGQMDLALDNVDKYLIGLFYEDENIPIIERVGSRDAYELARIHLADKFYSAMLAYQVGGFFATTPGAEDFILANDQSRRVLTLAQRSEFRSFFQARIRAGVTNGWVLARVAERDIAYRILEGQPVSIGAWFDVGTLLAPLTRSDAAGTALLVDNVGHGFPPTQDLGLASTDLSPRGTQDYTVAGDRQRYLVLGVPSTKGAFRMVSVLPDDLILQSLPTLRVINGVVTTSIVLLLVLFYILLRRLVLQPLGLLTKAMSRLRAGDLEARVLSVRHSREFDLVTDTFNTMVEQIHDLRIHVYEEKLHAQRAELLFLRHQINPHFFLNSLNILYQLAQVKNFSVIQDLVLSLSRYLQFLSRTNTDFVPLADEWEHLKTYLKIQELRFPKRLTCRFTAPHPFPEQPVPPLLLQAFAENAIKHGARPDLGFDLGLCIESSDDHLVIRVEDSGPGFTPSQLDEFNRPAGEAEDHDHIGIVNTRRRLELLYDGRATLKFSNKRSPLTGAVVEIGLPSLVDFHPLS